MDLADRPLDLAVALARLGATFTVVGGAARRLRGRPHVPRDLDVLVDAASVASFRQALDRIGADVPRRFLPATRVATSWGPLDVFVGRAGRVRAVEHAGHRLWVPR